jgi:hypothetical protein
LRVELPGTAARSEVSAEMDGLLFYLQDALLERTGLEELVAIAKTLDPVPRAWRAPGWRDGAHRSRPSERR